MGGARILCLLSTLAVGLVTGGASFAKTYYLDGNLANDCTSGNYSIANRNCSGTDGDAYNTLVEAEQNLAGGDTLYIRQGTYSGPAKSRGNAPSACFRGILDVVVDGSPGNPTLVAGYPGEQPVIEAWQGHSNYNPNPGDTSQTSCSCGPGGAGQGGGVCYYPNPAVVLAGDWITLRNVKTYGQVAVLGSGNHDITVEDSDIGGCGPYNNQGQALVVDSNPSGEASWNVTIRNNRIHHGCWGESNQNGATLIVYTTHVTIQNNEFSNGWGSDIWLKRLQGTSGRDIVIEKNIFRRSNVRPGNNGVEMCSQFCEARSVTVRNNIFLDKGTGLYWYDTSEQSSGGQAYNNTFINSTSHDVYSWTASPLGRWFNNLHYNTNGDSGDHFYRFDGGTSTASTANYNCFYPDNGVPKYMWNPSATHSSLASHRNSSGVDQGSLTFNPNFIAPNGNDPEDFKRSSYSENFGGSPYTNRCGAYVTGNETIGPSIAGGSGDGGGTPPERVQNLRIVQ